VAGYYAYLWTQMLADDGYQWFVEQGGLTCENGQRFREAILSRGNICKRIEPHFSQSDSFTPSNRDRCDIALSSCLMPARRGASTR